MVRQKDNGALLIEPLYKEVKDIFNTFETPKQCKISTADCLMSGLAVYGLKYESLLQFADAVNDEIRKKNLCQLFGITNIPSDTYMRERLDVIHPRTLQPAFTSIISAAEKNNLLKKFEFLDGRYLIPNDGTVFFHPIQYAVNTVARESIKMARSSFTIKLWASSLCTLINRMFSLCWCQNISANKMETQKMIAKGMRQNV